MIVSLAVATALWLLPVGLTFLVPQRGGRYATASAPLLPVALLALLVGFLLIAPVALGGGALITLAAVLISLLARGGRPGRSAARLLLLALSPALLFCLIGAWLTSLFRAW